MAKTSRKGDLRCSLRPVNPKFVVHHKGKDYDVTKPRIAVYKHSWKILQNTVYWCILRVAQIKGLQFYQTRSNGIILYNTKPAMCIEKVVVRKSREEFHSKTYQSAIAPQRVANLLHERRERPSIILTSTVVRAVQETRSHRQRGSPEIDSPVRESPNMEALQADKTKSRVQSVQRAVERHDLHGNHGLLRDLRDHS